MSLRRHTKSSPCPVCSGHQDMARGKGERCAGWTSEDGKWCHCSRVGGGRSKWHDGSMTWSHALSGKCPCGEVHGDGTTDEWPPRNAPGGPKRDAGQVRQIGDTARAPIVATYPYQDRHGRLLYEVCRTEPKSFRQRRPDGKGGWLWNMQGQKTTLYRLPELWAGLAAGDSVWIAEGEKDVDALRAHDLVATCNTGGAGKWRHELGAIFARAQPGSRVVIVQDRDDPGRAHALQVYESVREHAPESVAVVIVEARSGKDAADHLGAGLTPEQFEQVYPIADDLLERDPQTFKRYMLRRALATPKTVLTLIDRDFKAEDAERRQPLFKTGLVHPPFYPHWRGAVAISGEPSAGKSYLAISTAIDAALAGWDVVYLSCEMHADLIRDRAARALASADIGEHDWRNQVVRAEAITRARRLELPERWHHVDVGIGVEIEMVIEQLAAVVTHRPTLVVFDSVSSFVDNMASGREAADAFGMAGLKDVTRWLVGTRKLTHGHLAFLILSEMNRDGRARGRFLDHRCDTAIALRTDPEQRHLKAVDITKNWWGRTGLVGRFLLDWELGRLVFVDQAAEED